MVRKLKTVPVDKHKVKDFIAVARNFFDGAEVAAEYEYWNAAGVLIVHSAIAYSDAITVKFGKAKSKSEDHQDVINLIDSLVAGSEEKKKALIQLSKIISHKNLVSYGGDIYSKKDIEKLWKYLERYVSWADNILKN
jgi:HEPN domain-containing protein